MYQEALQGRAHSTTTEGAGCRSMTAPPRILKTEFWIRLIVFGGWGEDSQLWCPPQFTTTCGPVIATLHGRG